MKKTILFIGPLPPPAGGISIHIKRLSELLKNDYNFEYIDESNPVKPGFFNIRSLNLFKYLARVTKTDLVFIHSGNHILRCFHIVMSKLFFRKIILTIHAYPFKNKKLVKYFEEIIYRQADKIILVNANLADKIKLPQQNCIVQNAFLPPLMETEQELPAEIQAWIKKVKNGRKTIMCANAWQLEIFENEDLYGLDMCIEAVRRLKKNGFSVAFIFNVASTDKLRDTYLKYQASIKELALTEDFLLINERLSFVKLIEKANIVLRPTNTDGDALTVREALFLGKPVVASDVVERPAGATLFKTRDVEDMVVKLAQLMNKGILSENSKNESKDYYYEFYKNLIEEAIKKN